MKSIELDKNEIEKTIILIDSLDLSKVKIAEIEELLTPLFKGYTISADKYDSGMYVYRSILYNKHKPTFLKNLTYPPVEYITDYGRANDIGQQMFYCSIQKGVPYFELPVSVGDKVVTSVWKTKSSLLLNHIGFTNEISSELTSNRILEDSYDFVKKTKNFSDLNAFVYNYLASKFSRVVSKSKSYLYKLSIAIANKLLMGNIFDGILYPSIAVAANSDNLVLLPKYVDANLEFVSAEYFEISKGNDTQLKSDILDSAVKIDSHGNIIWTGKHLGWQLPPGSETSFNSQGDEWIPNTNTAERMDPVPTSDIKTSYTALQKRFINSFPATVKFTKEITIQNNVEKTTAEVMLLINMTNKKRYLAFYLPCSQNPIGICKAILSNFQQFLSLDEGNEIIEKDKITQKQIASSKECLFSNEIYIFSENFFDTSKLPKPQSIVAKFEFN